MAQSIYYELIKQMEKEESLGTQEARKERGNGRRPSPGYLLTFDGKKIPDDQIKEWLCELVCDDGFLYDYPKLTVCLRMDFGLKINHEKVYRLCRKSNLLKSQRSKRGIHADWPGVMSYQD